MKYKNIAELIRFPYYLADRNGFIFEIIEIGEDERKYLLIFGDTDVHMIKSKGDIIYIELEDAANVLLLKEKEYRRNG